MVVTVVQIGDVGMGVSDDVVSMRVAVSPIEAAVVAVFVVIVVVDVFVVVSKPIMTVTVFVVGSQRQADASRCENDGNELQHFDRITEHGPGNGSSDEWRGGENHLASGRTQFSRAFDPQRDRQPISGGADEQRSKDIATVGG